MSDQVYLYAIADAEAVDPDGWTGVKDASVEVLRHEALAAVVSAAPDGKLRPRRRNLKAHHDLLKALMDEATILPMAFGVLADSEEQVRTFLRQHATTLQAQLDQVRGHVEMGFRVSWNVDDIFSYFVEEYDELRELRDAVFSGDGEPSRQDKIHVGERFEELLESARMRHREAVEDHLGPACRAIEADDPKDESEVMNLACLVPRDGVDAFEDAIMEAAEDFSDDFTFTYTDPMAPYSFADVAFGER
jgi:hypothetical protein